MDKNIFGLDACLDEETTKRLKEVWEKTLELLKEMEAKEKEKEGAKPEEPEEDDDSDTRIYNVIHDGELYFVRGDRFEYTENGYMLYIFNGDTKVAVFQGHPSIIDESYFFGSEEDEE